MQYILILIAFLCEVTVNPLFIKTSFDIQSIFIVYFTILIIMQKKMPVAFPAILLLVSSIITGEIPALSAFLLLLASFVYHKVFLTRERSKSSTIKPTQAASIGMFMVILLIVTFAKVLIISLFGYTIVMQSEVFSYIFNTVIFIIFTICAL